MAVTLIIEYFGHASALMIAPFAALVNITMLEGFFFLPSVDGAYWTLTVEIAFYASMLGLWWLNGVRRVEQTILLWLAARLVFAFLWPNMPERLVMLLVLRYIPFFTIGMVAYRVWSGQRSMRDQAPVVAAILFTVAVTATVDYLIAAALLVLIFCLMLNGALRWLRLAPLIWVGEISYSLYLVHQHIGFTIMLNMDAAGWNPVSGYVVAVATAFLLGWLINRTIERPAGRYIIAKWRRRQLDHAQRVVASAPFTATSDPVKAAAAAAHPVDSNADSL